ncbi:MAG TPA: hypothetical protein VFU23_08005 [Gemmatimonadales bacterium]|nr:hypothetical protein [Gemmatimonadales bacterium]
MRHHRVRFGAFVILSGGFAAGCGGSDAGGGKAATRDSAGISIVENSGPAWSSDRGWKVVDSPLVDIGDVDHVFGPVPLSDGRLAVANAGTNEVRIYDARGALLKSSGRAGSGPGEYQNLAGIWRGPGDSVMVSDVLVRRVSVLDREGAFARSVTLGGAGASLMPTSGTVSLAIPSGWLDDGSILGVAQSFGIGVAREGTFRDSLMVIVYGPDGLARDTVGRFPGPEMEQMTLSFGGRSMPAPTPVPLGRQFVGSANGDRFYLSVNNAWEIEVRGLDGSLKRLIRSDIKPATITPDDIAANRKEMREQMESQPMMRNVPDAIKQQLTARIDQAKYPATFAFFAGLLTDQDGNLWAQEASASSSRAQRYAVIDSSGRFLGRVTMPASFRTSSIGSDAVYGVWKDPDDVEHVRVYPLRKTSKN